MNLGIAICDHQVNWMAQALCMDIRDDFDARMFELIRANLRRLRKGRGLTQAALAEAAGVPRGTYGPVESGHDNPRLSLLARVAPVLGVQIGEIFGAPPAILPASVRGEIRAGGVVSDSSATYHVASCDLPSLEIREGDVIQIAPGEMRVGRVVLLDEGGDARLHLVRSMDPDVILVRDGAPPVVFDPDYHDVIGIMKTQTRDRS